MRRNFFVLLALSILPTMTMAQGTNGFYGIAEGTFAYSKQFEIGADHSNNFMVDRVILETNTKGAVALGAGYDFSILRRSSGKKVGNRIEFEAGIGLTQNTYNETVGTLIDSQLRIAQLQLSWARVKSLTKNLKYVPMANLGFRFEIPYYKGTDGDWYDKSQSSAPYFSVNPLVLEYQVNDRLGTQFSIGELGMFSVKTKEVDYRYYTAAFNFNTLSARIIYRF